MLSLLLNLLSNESVLKLSNHIFFQLLPVRTQKTTIYLSHINVSHHAVIQDSSINQQLLTQAEYFYFLLDKTNMI